MRLVRQCGQRARLGDAVDAEVVADLVEALDHARLADRVADARAGHAVGLGEGAEADDLRIGDVDRRRGAGRRELAIGLVEAEHGAGRQPRDQRLDGRAVPPGAHRVVRVGEEQQARLLLVRERQQGVGILAVVDVRRGDQPPAIAGDMEVEGGIGAERGRDRHARLDEQAHDVAEQSVDALAHHDVLRLHAVLRGQRVLEVVVLGIAVFPGIGRLLAHRLDGARRRAEHALVGADAGAEQAAALALLRFRPDEGHGRGQLLDDGGIGRQ